MPDVASWYRALDLEPGASPDEIKQAWRDLAQVWHPDRFGGNDRLRQKAEETLKQINEAYEGLRGLDPAEGRTAASASKSSPAYEPEIYDRAEPETAPIEILAEGVQKWNLWRKKYSDVVPKLPLANLHGRSLEGVDFREVDLSGADLREADLYKANLSEAVLKRARLAGADLNRSLLLSTVLVEADLSGADLSSADLRGADLRLADLSAANLVGARLEGANLADARGLETTQVELASIDADTCLPNLRQA